MLQNLEMVARMERKQVFGSEACREGLPNSCLRAGNHDIVHKILNLTARQLREIAFRQLAEKAKQITPSTDRVSWCTF